MPPKKARFGHRGKGGGKGGKGDRGYGSSGSWRGNYRDRDSREMTTKVTTAIGEIEVAHTGPLGTEEDETRGAMAPPLRNHVTVIDP